MPFARGDGAIRGTAPVVAVGKRAALLRASAPKEGSSPPRRPDLTALAGCVSSGAFGIVLVSMAAIVSSGL